MLSNIIKLKGSDSNKDINNNNNPYLEFKSSTPMTITPKYTTDRVNLQYSLDTETWYNIANNSATPSATTIYFRGRATGSKGLFTSDNSNNAWAFTGASQLEVNGNITMLLQDEFSGNVPDIPLNKYAFSRMFMSCTALVKAPSLPATTLADYCYNYMFYQCTSLTVAPELPATTLADNCYYNMFNNCISLTVAPELPATTLASDCYNGMFYYCTSLTVAPTLPATTLASYCYQYMFYKCTSLAVAPKLPATTLANYCYYNMFRDCTKLTVAPELPATTLALNCYSSMFYYCTSLTVAPELPATTLAESCYQYMFYNCSSLKFSSTKNGIYQKEYRIPKTGTISSEPSNWNNNMFSNTGGTFAGTPTINRIYYVPNGLIQ